MVKQFGIALVSTVIMLTPVNGEDQWSDLRLKIIWDSEGLPELTNIPVTYNTQICGDSVQDDRLIIDRETKGISNVVVFVNEGRGGVGLTRKHPSQNPPQTQQLSVEACRIEPRVTLLQKGDELFVLGAQSKAKHALNIPTLVNPVLGTGIPPGRDWGFTLDYAEPGAIPITCNMHPWMKGYLLVLEHRYAGVSDRNGMVTIKNLPVGETLSFVIFHETIRFSGLSIGESVLKKNAHFEVTVEKGTNDLGVIRVPPSAFHQP